MQPEDLYNNYIGINIVEVIKELRDKKNYCLDIERLKTIDPGVEVSALSPCPINVGDMRLVYLYYADSVGTVTNYIIKVDPKYKKEMRVLLSHKLKRTWKKDIWTEKKNNKYYIYRARDKGHVYLIFVSRK